MNFMARSKSYDDFLQMFPLFQDINDIISSSCSAELSKDVPDSFFAVIWLVSSCGLQKRRPTHLKPDVCISEHQNISFSIPRQSHGFTSTERSHFSQRKCVWDFSFLRKLLSWRRLLIKSDLLITLNKIEVNIPIKLTFVFLYL